MEPIEAQLIIAKVDQALDDVFRELALRELTGMGRWCQRADDTFDEVVNTMTESSWGDAWFAQRARIEKAVRKVLMAPAQTQLQRRAG
ncbi:MAG: hypothetical protein WCC97_14440 [Candidatus Acidiferrales bacterium]